MIKTLNCLEVKAPLITRHPPMAAFTIPPRPPPLPVFKTCVFKTVGKISILVDIYLPDSNHAAPRQHPIMLFVHGGGWTGSNRSDYCRPLFHDFLARGFVVASMDYRLLPESSFAGQLEDIRDIERWLRDELPAHLERSAIKIDRERIVVVGASAGAHLGLFTPKLWKTSPVAILSMYAPTNMHRLPYLGLGRLSKLAISPCTPELLNDATDYSNPPTGIKIPTCADDYAHPRGIMSNHIFRKGLLAEFLLRGLSQGAGGALTLPEKGCVDAQEIDEISPMSLSTKLQYPPVYQVMGSGDEIFEISHLIDFHDSLRSSGIKCERRIVPGQGHAFDMWADIGSPIHEDIIRPAVEWVVEAACMKVDMDAE